MQFRFWLGDATRINDHRRQEFAKDGSVLGAPGPRHGNQFGVPYVLLCGHGAFTSLGFASHRLEVYSTYCEVLVKNVGWGMREFRCTSLIALNCSCEIPLF